MSRAVKALIFTWIVICLLLAFGGGFYWGMKYQKSHSQSSGGDNLIQDKIGTSPSASSSTGSQSNTNTGQPSGNASSGTNQNIVK